MREALGFYCAEQHISKQGMSETAASLARGLASIGITQGDAVALLLRNDLVFLQLTEALSSLGAYAVPVNWHFTSGEVNYILSDCNAKIIIGHSDLLAPILDELADTVLVYAVPTPQFLLENYPSKTGRDATELGAIAILSSLQGATVDTELNVPENPMTIIYTSGTTGRPKGVVRKPAAKEHAVLTRALREKVYGIKEGARALVPGPLYHSAPNSFSMLALRNASCFVVMPKFDAEKLLALIEEFQIDTLFAVPTMFVRLLELSNDVRNSYDISSLKFVIHGAAPCAPDIKRRMIAWFGPVINEFYGATETGLFTLCSSTEWLSKPGTVGRAIDGIDIRILKEDGQRCAVMEHGEIYIKNPMFPDFTYHNREADRSDIERDGYISCGDIGYFDNDGFLFLCDRAKDMIISGGVNIYPAEIEAALFALDEIADCAVFGIPDKEFGESVFACVELRSGSQLDAASIKQRLKADLATFKIPRRIERITRMPRDDSGKIFKRKLREQYWQSSSVKI